MGGERTERALRHVWRTLWEQLRYQGRDIQDRRSTLATTGLKEAHRPSLPSECLIAKIGNDRRT